MSTGRRLITKGPTNPSVVDVCMALAKWNASNPPESCVTFTLKHGESISVFVQRVEQCEGSGTSLNIFGADTQGNDTYVYYRADIQGGFVRVVPQISPRELPN